MNTVLPNAVFLVENLADTITFVPAEGELEDLIEEFNDGKVQFAFVKVKDPNSGLPKFVLIAWVSLTVLFINRSIKH